MRKEVRIDWDGMYKDFTQGEWVINNRKTKGNKVHYLQQIHYPEVGELAEKYQCGKQTIYQRMSFDRHDPRGIGDWRIHRKNIQAKRKEEALAAGEEGGRFNYHVTESAKVDSIAMDTLKKILTQVRLEINVIEKQRDKEFEAIAVNPEEIGKFKFQSQVLQTNAKTVDSVVATFRKIIGEAVDGVGSEKDLVKAETAANNDPQTREKEIERSIALWEKLKKKRQKLGEALEESEEQANG